MSLFYFHFFFVKCNEKLHLTKENDISSFVIIVYLLVSRVATHEHQPPSIVKDTGLFLEAML